MMRKKTQNLRLALVTFLATGGVGVNADQQPSAIRTLPGGLNISSAAAVATLSQWEMITDPMTGLENQTPVAAKNFSEITREHWVQLVPQADLSSPSPEPLPPPPDADTLKIVSPILVDEEGAKDEDKKSIYPTDRNIRSISLDITAPAGTMPPDAFASTRQSGETVSGFEPRPWQDDAYFWESPIFCHRPLYFEERCLERYGQVRYPLLRPAVSGAHFFASYVALPYQAAMHPPCKCVPSSQPSSLQWKHPSTLGQQDLKAAAVQTAAVAGLILLVP
ncbi:MAG TPA: hypothetical protein DDZ51_15730 [Planctomycetaceae bacterium]|nr:hypothetical protein [Planctomycetaceae bacterium]